MAIITPLTRKEVKARFPVRWSIEIGTHATAEALVADIQATGVQFGAWARYLLPKVTISPVCRTLRLVAPSVAELGFTRATPPLREIHARAIETYGLALSPSEAALQLRHHYTNQPRKERLLMAMEALEDPPRYPRAFSIARGDDDRWVFAFSGHPGSLCSPDDRLVFVLPQA